METPQNDLQTMAPKPVIWTIGHQEFEQTPVTLDQLADIMDVIVEEVLASGKGELLTKLIDSTQDKDSDAKAGDTKDEDVASKAKKAAASMDQEMLVSFIRILATLPRAMPRIVAAILNADLAHFRAHLRMRDAVGILRIFVKQNDVGDIIADFFGLFNDLKAAIPTTEEEMPSDSA